MAGRQKKANGKFKFDYNGDEFYEEIERLASQGYTDASIAYGLADRFGVGLVPQTFSTFRNERTKEGELTRRAQRINEALAHGRGTLMQAARLTYIQMALGQRVVKTSLKDGEGNTTQVTEMEVAPNMQALATLLFNHDDEWRENILRKRREEAEASSSGEGGLPSTVNVRITYNQKSDLELQDKFRKPSE